MIHDDLRGVLSVFHLSVLVLPLHRVFLGNIGALLMVVFVVYTLFPYVCNMSLCHCAIVGLSVLCYTMRLHLYVFLWVLSVIPVRVMGFSGMLRNLSLIHI